MLVLVAAGAALTACDDRDPGAAPAGGMAARIDAGDRTVCADRHVQQAFVRTLIGDDAFRNFLANGNKVPPFTAADATAANGGSGVILCSATANMGSGLMGDSTVSVKYDVRSSPADPSGFAVDASSANEGNGVFADWLSTRAVPPGQADGAGAAPDQQPDSDEPSLGQPDNPPASTPNAVGSDDPT